MDTREGIAVLHLNRPESRNAMDEVMAREFEMAIKSVADLDYVKALILTGRGSSFSAGGDLRTFLEWTNTPIFAIEKKLLEFYRCFLKIMELKIPTIAAINGPALGAGACLAMACDLRLALETATIGFTFIKLGINPGMGAEYLLNRLIGPSKTIELLMFGSILTATDAYNIGLINRLVSNEQLMKSATEIARNLVQMPSSALKIIKQNLLSDNAFLILENILEKEVKNQKQVFKDQAFKEKIKSNLKILKTKKVTTQVI